MEVGIIGLVVFIAFIVGMFLNRNADPRDSAAGRWGTKVGKVARGEFGGKKWGERED